MSRLVEPARSDVPRFQCGSSCGGMGADVCFINVMGNWTGDPRNGRRGRAANVTGATSITLSSTTNLKVGSILILDQLDDPATDNGAIWVCQPLISVRRRPVPPTGARIVRNSNS